jgi:hypothetical protein
MVHFNAAKMTVAETRRFENMMADVERNKAHTDYIAMMNDVELPTPEDDMEVIHNEKQN